MQENTISPISQDKRLQVIDILRGWAILGVVLMNYANYANFDLPLTRTGNIINQLTEYVFAVKSWSLLSLLFGFGFGALYEKISKSNQHPNRFYVKRMGILFLFSIIDSAFYSGDILHDYALLGCCMLLFINMPAKSLFWAGGILLLITPLIGTLVAKYLMLPEITTVEKLLHDQYTGGHFFITLMRNLTAVYFHEIRNMDYTITVHCQMLGLMFLGLGAFKKRLFENLQALKKQIQYICLNALLVTIVLIEIRSVIIRNHWPVGNYYQMSWLRYDTSVAFIVTGFSLLYLRMQPKLGILGILSNVGKMALTNYLVQNLLIFLLFSGVGLGLAFKHTTSLYYAIAIIVFILQALFSKAWLKAFQFGPAEWCWRSLSYGKWLKNRKTL
jgi:uncharacterized protein